MAPALKRYRHFECGTWTSGDFRKLSGADKPNAQTLWVYLLTCPQTTSIPGLFALSVPDVADYFRWPIKGTRKCLQEIVDAGMARYDADARLVWLPNALRERNLPPNPNVVTSWRKPWGELPDCALKNEARTAIGRTLEGLGERYREEFAKACGEPLANGLPIQDQEQEQISDLNKNQTSALSCLRGGRGR